MAIGTTTEPKNESSSNDYDRFILQQIERTQRKVRVTELATLVLMLAVGMLGFFLIVTIVDHWIVGLGFWARFAALLVLIAGSMFFVVTRVVPYVVRSINPIYAARAIEKSTPNVKNGLINFLLLRDRPREVRSAVFDAVQKRAAVDLSNIEIDLAVDRTLMIRLGYALAVLVAIAGAYKILSPKDPVATVARVIAPWEQIARPSRVQIERVTPGNVTVYRGQLVEISAAVLGVNGDDPVYVVYSSEDGQVVNATLSMKQDGGSTYIATLGGTSGMQLATVYHIQGGDAKSIEYRIDVKEAPSIDVKRVDYDFALYTEIPAESTNVGDIRAVEGTKISIFAEANQPIALAYLELMPGTPKTAGTDGGKKDNATSKSNASQFRTVRMRHSGQSATATFVLQLQSDRKTPEYCSYRVRFSNEAGERNDRPVLHQIEVTPDLTPVVEILSPKERDVEVAANRSIDFEVRGVDPDYKLDALTVMAATGGNNILKTNLLEQDESGQVIRKYRFQPQNLALKPGMSVLVWAVAADNRHSPKTGQLEPNTARTENYRVRIVAPDRFESEPNEDEKQPDSTSNQDDQKNEQGENEEGDGDGSGGVKSNDSSDSSSSKSENQGQSGTGSENENDSDQNIESTDDSADGGGQSSDSNSSESDSSESNSGGARSDNDNSTPSDPSKTDSTSNAGDSGEGTREEPVASDGTNDPDAFERILDHMREDGQDVDSQSDDEQDSDSGDSESDSNNDDSENPDDGPSGDRGEDDPPGNADRNLDGTDEENDPRDDASGKSDGSEQRSDAESRGQEPKDGKNGPSDGERNDDSTDGAGDDDNSEANQESGTDNDRSPRNNGDTESNDPKSDDPRADNPKADGSDNDRQPNGEGSNDEGSNDESSSDDSDADPEHRNANGENGTDAHRPGKTDADTKPGDSNSNEDFNAGTDASTDDSENENPLGDSESGDPNGESTGDSDDRQPKNGGNEDTPGNSAEKSAGGDDKSSASTTGEAPEVEGQDDPNLEYARKATDMAIEYLKDKKNNRELLDEMGWTEADANSFIKRWQKMQKDSAARNNSKRAKRDWNDALKSLGLKPKSNGTKTQSGKDRRRDTSSISSDSGSRSKPPKSYADQFRAYLKESDSDQ